MQYIRYTLMTAGSQGLGSLFLCFLTVTETVERHSVGRF